MPNTKSRKSTEPRKVTEKAKSFHGRIQAPVKPTPAGLRRPKTQPELLSSRNASPTAAAVAAGAFVARPTKVLVNVTVKGSLGPLHLLISPEATVGELIAAAVGQCAKEGRRSVLASSDAGRFDLHYSQFSLESLDRDAKLITLGSRNFFLCPKSPAPAPVPAAIANDDGSSCSQEARKASPFAFKWQWLVDLLV